MNNSQHKTAIPVKSAFQAAVLGGRSQVESNAANSLSSRDEVGSSRRPIKLEFIGQNTREKKAARTASFKDLF